MRFRESKETGPETIQLWTTGNGYEARLPGPRVYVLKYDIKVLPRDLNYKTSKDPDGFDIWWFMIQNGLPPPYVPFPHASLCSDPLLP